MYHDVQSLEKALRESAEKWRGTPFFHAGKSSKGIDCFNLTLAIYADVGIEAKDLRERPYEPNWWLFMPEAEYMGLLYPQGTEVSKSELLPGYFLVFRAHKKPGKGPINHSGVYLGKDEFVHIPPQGVRISELTERYWKAALAACFRPHAYPKDLK